MKTFAQLAVILFLLVPGVCLASKIKTDTTPPDTESLVTAISVASDSQGKITISGDATPFVVSSGTTIVIDGQPATLRDVKKGMQVLSRTLSDSSAPEIDLKTVKEAKTAKS